MATNQNPASCTNSPPLFPHSRTTTPATKREADHRKTAPSAFPPLPSPAFKLPSIGAASQVQWTWVASASGFYGGRSGAEKGSGLYASPPNRRNGVFKHGRNRIPWLFGPINDLSLVRDHSLSFPPKPIIMFPSKSSGPPRRAMLTALFLGMASLATSAAVMPLCGVRKQNKTPSFPQEPQPR